MRYQSGDVTKNSPNKVVRVTWSVTSNFDLLSKVTPLGLVASSSKKLLIKKDNSNDITFGN